MKLGFIIMGNTIGSGNIKSIFASKDTSCSIYSRLQIPDPKMYPELKRLTINTPLDKIPDYPLLEDLVININLRVLPNAPRLRRLLCAYTNINIIPDRFPLLEILSCNANCLIQLQKDCNLRRLSLYEHANYPMHFPDNHYNLENYEFLSLEEFYFNYKAYRVPFPTFPKTENFPELRSFKCNSLIGLKCLKRPIYIKTDRRRVLLLNLIINSPIRETYIIRELT
jgi:hypothetical protein